MKHRYRTREFRTILTGNHPQDFWVKIFGIRSEKKEEEQKPNAICGDISETLQKILWKWALLWICWREGPAEHDLRFLSQAGLLSAISYTSFFARPFQL